MFVGKARRSLPFLVAFGLLLALGCARAQAPAQPALGPAEQKLGEPQQVGPKQVIRGGALVQASFNEPLGWDPLATTAAATNTQVTMALEGLTQMIAFDGDAKTEPGDIRVVPLLAESWEQKSDTEFVFKLRQGVKFKDNAHTLQAVPGGLLKDREMTAEDVVFSYKRAANPLLTTRETNWKAQAIKEVVALDRYTVRVTLREPYSPFLVYIGGNPFWIVPHETIEKWGNMKRADSLIATGPFILEQYKPGVIIRFKRNPDYYQKGLPYLDEVIRPVKFAEGNLAAFRAGKLDTVGVAWGQMENMQKSNPDAYWEMNLPTGQGHFIATRTDQKPFDDIRVRRAIAMSVDYDGWVASRCGKYAHLGCKAYPYHGTVPVGIVGYYLPVEEWPPEGKEYYSYNPQRARELLAEAGYPNGFDTILNVGGADYYGAASVENWDISQKFLADIGIRAAMKSKLYTLYATSTWLGDYEGIAGPSGSHGYTEPNDFTYRTLFPGTTGNVSHVDDPVLTKMLLAQLHTYDIEKRKEITKQIAKRVLEMAWVVTWPGAFTSSPTAYQPWFLDRVTKSGACWANTGAEYVQSWIDPSKKPKAALTVTSDGQRIVAANPQGLGVSNPLGRTSGQC